MEIVFVRHGSTDWNRERRFQGQSNVPLNAEGRAQASALATILAGTVFDRLVSSDLERALETARTICGDAPIEKDARWREFDFGSWEGLTWEQIAARWPQAGEDGRAARGYSPPGGETFGSVCERVGAALRELRQAQNTRVLVVTHAGPLHAVLHVLFGEAGAEAKAVSGIRFMPAGITRIEIAGDDARILVLNDVAHLA